eukprot:501295-Karenia_brevis.AAC.1
MVADATKHGQVGHAKGGGEKKAAGASHDGCKPDNTAKAEKEPIEGECERGANAQVKEAEQRGSDTTTSLVAGMEAKSAMASMNGNSKMAVAISDMDVDAIMESIFGPEDGSEGDGKDLESLYAADWTEANLTPLKPTGSK